jgi:hypothetical protein
MREEKFKVFAHRSLPFFKKSEDHKEEQGCLSNVLEKSGNLIWNLAFPGSVI